MVDLMLYRTDRIQDNLELRDNHKLIVIINRRPTLRGTFHTVTVTAEAAPSTPAAVCSCPQGYVFEVVVDDESWWSYDVLSLSLIWACGKWFVVAISCEGTRSKHIDVQIEVG